MIILLILLGIAFWGACGIVTYKGVFAYAQKEYTMIALEKRRSDRFIALGFALIGPVSLPIWACLSGFFKHGFSAGTVEEAEQRYEATCEAIKAEVRARYR